jgi:hypothetical protein
VLSIDSFKMIDEISLVKYSDEETADSDQLESFRKFCEEQNSGRGCSARRSRPTPSASNTDDQLAAEGGRGASPRGTGRFAESGW